MDKKIKIKKTKRFWYLVNKKVLSDKELSEFDKLQRSSDIIFTEKQKINYIKLTKKEKDLLNFDIKQEKKDKKLTNKLR